MNRAEHLLEDLEILAKSIFDSVEGDVWKKRSAVANACGSMDAKTMCHLHETHGLSVIDQVIYLRSKGSDLRVPYEMLEHEFICMGKKTSSIHSLLVELKTFDRIKENHEQFA